MQAEILADTFRLWSGDAEVEPFTTDARPKRNCGSGPTRRMNSTTEWYYRAFIQSLNEMIDDQGKRLAVLPTEYRTLVQLGHRF